MRIKKYSTFDSLLDSLRFGSISATIENGKRSHFIWRSAPSS